ncbi:flagellar basal body L-ring protein FlgH [Desulfobotulus sp. H1]|uniref:Flagellar L-ring protein n=1 Tax=Desulfobotulus pelophilus TaxID=2823377 RepID=A0ABT3N4J6_9BACT|nr:flagellar basal body L-ring protein FlgH [Desulfobotulus pelophilus]MCW7752376.1 flagellar basal body L-ring protein FlgH [Desulfobotulus pelophilus]
MDRKRWLLTGVGLAMLAGCGGSPPSQQASLAPHARGVEAPAAFFGAVPPAEGSLWSESGDMLFTDQRARRVGDTVIVDIVENASSQVAANTKLERDSTTRAGIPNAFGLTNNLGGNIDPARLFQANTVTDFDGSGKSDRSGRITASIGARVVQVLPNGNVMVYGSRELRVNHETQYITVSGVIRPKDIGSDNRVQSTVLADARIEYSGRGVIAEKQKPGWMTRVIDRYWPF